MSDLRGEIQTALNRASAENGSGTPDHVLAVFLLASLEAFDHATRARDRWWSFEPKIGGRIPAYDALAQSPGPLPPRAVKDNPQA